MDIKYKFKRPARAIEETIDTKVAEQMANYDNGINFVDDSNYPIYYGVKVQIKIWFLWTTIWEKYCDISDGDTRQYIINEANQLLKIMEGRTRTMNNDNK